jgi:hypothetical protein
MIPRAMLVIWSLSKYRRPIYTKGNQRHFCYNLAQTSKPVEERKNRNPEITQARKAGVSHAILAAQAPLAFPHFPAKVRWMGSISPDISALKSDALRPRPIQIKSLVRKLIKTRFV